MQKLKKPPYVHNWVRYNFPEVEKTTKKLVSFAKSFPPYSYQHANKLLRDRLNLGVNWEMLIRSAKTQGKTNSRPYCVELLEAFREFEQTHELSGRQSFDFEVLPWRISREIKIPVRPLTSLVQNGRLEPVFVFGWARFELTEFQIRLMMTVIEDAVFTLQDYQQSKGHFIILPKDAESGTRKGSVWHRGDYELLTQKELRDQVDIYLEALEQAQKLMETSEIEASSPIFHSEIDPRQKSFDF